MWKVFRLKQAFFFSCVQVNIKYKRNMTIYCALKSLRMALQHRSEPSSFRQAVVLSWGMQWCIVTFAFFILNPNFSCNVFSPDHWLVLTRIRDCWLLTCAVRKYSTFRHPLTIYKLCTVHRLRNSLAKIWNLRCVLEIRLTTICLWYCARHITLNTVKNWSSGSIAFDEMR